MPGVVFLIVVPTANYERELAYGTSNELPPPIPAHQSPLNINLPENNALLRLEVELRDKNAPKYRRGVGHVGAGRARTGGGGRGGRGRGIDSGGGIIQPVPIRQITAAHDNLNIVVPMEKVLEELLTKLEIEHVTWSTGKKGYYYHVVFPLQSGEPCETTLHCLTELGIGTKLNSCVSVLPCSVTYDAISDAANKDDYYDEGGDEGELTKWDAFVESIKSKLTVKQVVDGVRSGGSLSFDYLLLIVTADSLAALGLIENNAPNITAAMLVSPLMGPVMSITFGTIISDRELVRVGFITLFTGMFISLVFGFVFGLICGATEMPWGFNDWPTEEMRGRGNARSLWMGVAWALTSGTGVAVALLQGSAGPLIGVAISASLLPPVVNCGLFWALACIWLMRPGIKMPHIKGEPYYGNSSYEFIYTNYLPTEFLINGIVSCLLTVVNIICIFITAIIVLKIKEVSAPYTASPDLKRFWETDLRTVRKTNRSTMRNKRTFREKLLPYQSVDEPRSRELDTVLEQALKEATDDATFKKVKRMSYSSNAAGELTQRLGLNKTNGSGGVNDGIIAGSGSPALSRMNSIRNSKLNADLKALDKLVSSLLEHHQNRSAEEPVKLNRWRPLSRSAHSFGPATGQGGGGGVGGFAGNNNGGYSGSMQSHGQHVEHYVMENNFNVLPSGNNNIDVMGIGGSGGGGGVASVMPTILEQNRTNPSSGSGGGGGNSPGVSGGVRNILNTIANAPHRFSQSPVNDEETLNLTQNYIG